MGRCYTNNNGTVGGFSFAKQPSNSHEKFGMTERSDIVMYCVDETNFNEKLLQELLDKQKLDIKLKDIDVDDYPEILEKIDKSKDMWDDLYLGLVIYEDILNKGYSMLEAEL